MDMPKKTRSAGAIITPEQINQAVEIANGVAPLIRQRDAWLALASNPICGKPGFGFKAAKKFRRKADETELLIRQFDKRIVDFVSVKPRKLQLKLQELLHSEIDNWNQSNPVPTIESISQ